MHIHFGGGGGNVYERRYFKAVNCVSNKPRFCISFMLEITKPMK